MAAPPLALVHAVVRNLVPVAGIVFLGWSAANVLILYFVDTLLAIAVVLAGLMRHFLPPATEEGWAARVNAEAGYVGAALFTAVIIGVPLGVPLIFMLSEANFSVRGLFEDTGFRSGLILQAIAAFWSCRALYQALQSHSPEELRLKRHFSLVFLRWMAVLLATYFGLGFLLGEYAPLFFVAVYAVASIMIDVAPDKFLRAMPGGEEDADPLPGQRHAAPTHAGGRRKRKR